VWGTHGGLCGEGPGGLLEMHRRRGLPPPSVVDGLNLPRPTGGFGGKAGASLSKVSRPGFLFANRTAGPLNPFTGLGPGTRWFGLLASVVPGLFYAQGTGHVCATIGSILAPLLPYYTRGSQMTARKEPGQNGT
jgi:hypothetical protein